MNHCIKCESQVDYQKYCDSCVELYGLHDKQDTEFWEKYGNLGLPQDMLQGQLEAIFRDDMKGKTSNIKGTILSFRMITDEVDLRTLYKVKDQSGLWRFGSKPNKAKMVRMLQFGSDKTIIVDHTKNIGKSLAHHVIITNEGAITIGKALDNCQIYFDNKVVDIGFVMAGADTDNLREHICPDYNENLFERKHLRQLLGFYNAIVQGLENTKSSKLSI